MPIGPLLPLDPVRLHERLSGLPIGWDLIYRPSTDSTNRLARELIGSGRGHGLAVITDFQEAGRGRQGRGWHAPACSSVLLSVVVADPGGIHGTIIAALATSDAIEAVTGLNAVLKWPNDVLIRGEKVCGILAERVQSGSGPLAVVGIGINVNFDPSSILELPPGVTSLMRGVGNGVDREELIVSLFNSLNLWYRDVTHDAERVFAAWTSRLGTIGQPVTVLESSGPWEGIATGVQRDGALLVNDGNNHVRPVYAADVSIRTKGNNTTC